jgi:C-terminal processing protease CtpA/Prc
VIEALADKLERYYVFPDVGGRIITHLRARLAAGKYDGIEAGGVFCDTLTEDLRAINNDLHLRVRHSVDPRPLYVEEDISDNPERIEEYRQEAAARNFGFHKVEILPGNIGYLEQWRLDDAKFASATAIASMNLLASTRALIIDLRANGGGDPVLVALLCTFLFDGEPRHLNSFYSREDDKTRQFWTLPWVPGPRYLDKPVYVLTAKRTASGAEELAYNLQQMQRATIVGATTAGAAHPVGLYQLTPHFEASISNARAINPLTGTNWEGVGVIPDVPVAPEQALTTAHRMALEHILAHLDDLLPVPRTDLDREAREALDALGRT